MIPPISSKMHGTTSAAPLNEAVVRFGATQEMREQQRVERAADATETSLPRDEMCIEAPPEEAASGAEGAGGAASSQTARAGSQQHADASALDRRQAESEGLREQHEQAVAQHAAEQHGKREVVRGEGDRQTRSTREMMGRIESHSATSGTSSEKSAPSRASSAPARGPAHGGAPSRGTSPSRGGVSSAPPRATAPAPRGAARGGAGGDVMAAAVGSGAATIEEVAPGAAQARDRDDDNAQDVESSREGVSLRTDDTRKQVSRERSLDGHAGFHDGEGGRQESRPRFGEQRRGEAGSGSQSPSGDRSDEHARRSPDEQAGARPETSAAPEERSDVEPASVASLPHDDASTPTAPPAPPPDARVPPAAPTSASLDDGGVSDGAAPRAKGAAPQDGSDTVIVNGGPAPASAPLGLGLGDEYFFFDDARPQAEAPADAEP